MCRRYYQKFKSNNLLYKYIRAKNYLLKPFVISISTIFYREIEIIKSIILVTNLNIEFNFRNYHFLILFIVLIIIVIIIAIYVNFKYLVTLIDRVFLREQASDAYIYTIILLISVRGIELDHYLTNKYILLKIYFPEIRNNKDVRAKII